MKLTLTIILPLVAAVIFGQLSLNDPGYVVLTRDPYVVRLPLLMLILIVIVSFFILYLVLNFIVGLFRAPEKYNQWRNKIQEDASQKHTMQGYAGLIEGEWSKAEQSLLKKLDYNKTPLMNFLGAAYAAQQQEHFQRRDRYLDEALDKHPDQYLAVTLTRARLHYQAGELEAARNCLESIRESSPKNRSATTLLSNVYQELKDWHALINLLPTIRKLKLFPDEEIDQQEQSAYENILSVVPVLQNEASQSAQQSTITWESLPKKNKSPALMTACINQLIESDHLSQAEITLRKEIKKDYSSELIYLYGKVNGPDVESQIQLVEKLKKKHPRDPDLLLTMARLYRYCNKLEVAFEHYKQALEMGARDEIFADLGSLLEQKGESKAALKFYKKAMLAMTSENARGLYPSDLNHLILTEQHLSEEFVEGESSEEGSTQNQSESQADKTAESSKPKYGVVMPVVR